MVLTLIFWGCPGTQDTSQTTDSKPDGYGTTSTAEVCTAEESWVTNPSRPSEVPNNGNTLCDFYQFSYQWFLYLVSPSASSPGDRNYQVAADYPILDPSIDSCTSQPSGPTVFVRTQKASEAGGPFVVPELIDQADGNAVIYDQKGNVVYYAVQFSRGMCDVPQNLQEGDLPAGTIEIKTSWRDLTDQDTSGYFTMEADIEGVGARTLGMVGFHLVQSTEQHPEFIWATFEQEDNDPNCTNPQPAPTAGWSFTSAECAECLAQPTDQCQQNCNFNAAQENVTSLTGPPTEICRVYPDGTKEGDYEGQETAADNVADIDSLNKQVQGFLATGSSDLSVFQNYMLVGGLWESDPQQPSSDTSNQRGSLQLANTTMETIHQGPEKVLNCFVCHAYTPNMTATANYTPSHIFTSIHGPNKTE